MGLNIVRSSFMSAACMPDMLRSTRGRPVFMDLDSLLPPLDSQPFDGERLCLTDRARRALSMLSRVDRHLIVIAGRADISVERSQATRPGSLHTGLTAGFKECGAVLSGFFSCSHEPITGCHRACLCRAPMPGLLHAAAAALAVRSVESWMIGSTLDSIEAGHRAGCRTILLRGDEEWRWPPRRTPLHCVPGIDDAARIIAERREPTRAHESGRFV